MSQSDSRQPPEPLYQGSTQPLYRTPTLSAPAPTSAPAQVTQAAYASPVPFSPPPAKPGSAMLVLTIIGFSLAGLIGILVLLYLVLALGPGGVALGGVLALIPLAIVLLGVRWIDRWEPEPAPALAFGFLWGAAVAVFGALFVGLLVEVSAAMSGGSAAASEFVSAVIQAPLVEESGKGLGVLLIFLVARKHFDGPVDGVVYAAVVAGGFAFTENILYFAQQIGAGSGIAEIFVLRGLMAPFAHVMFTSCTGIALGIAARRTSTLGAIGIFFVGLIPAILLHALWNGALFIVDDFYGYYFIVQVPLFLGAVLLVRVLRRKEVAVTRARIAEYAAVGWFAPEEVDALATRAGRRATKRWAASHGLGPVMKRYTRDATRLAFTRQRLVTRRATAGAQAEEAALLASIVATRAQLATPIR